MQCVDLLAAWLPRTTVAALALLGGTLLGSTAAQEASLGVVAGTSAELRIEAIDVPRGRDRIGAALVVSADPGFDLSVRRSEAVGPLGTLAFDVDAGARLRDGAAARARLRVRGALGPVAARLEGAVWGAPPERFDPLADPGGAPFASGAELAVGGDGRLDRTWLARGRVAYARSLDGRDAVDVDAALRARRLLGRELDLSLRAAGRFAGDGEGGGSLGAGVFVAPRRAPESELIAWLDAGADGSVLPGLSSEGGWSLASGRLSWALRARPGAAGRAPLALSASWRRPLGEGSATVAATGTLGGDVGDTLRIGFTWRFAAEALASSTAP